MLAAQLGSGLTAECWEAAEEEGFTAWLGLSVLRTLTNNILYLISPFIWLNTIKCNKYFKFAIARVFACMDVGCSCKNITLLQRSGIKVACFKSRRQQPSYQAFHRNRSI